MAYDAPHRDPDPTPFDHLIEALESVSDEGYNQDRFYRDDEDCGTTCCALGWFTVRFGSRYGIEMFDHDNKPFEFTLNGVTTSPWELASTVFGVTEREAYAMFGGTATTLTHDFYGSDFRRENVIEKIRQFARARNALTVAAGS